MGLEQGSPTLKARLHGAPLRTCVKGGSEEPPPGSANATLPSWRAWPPCSRWLRSVPSSRSYECSQP